MPGTGQLSATLPNANTIGGAIMKTTGRIAVAAALLLLGASGASAQVRYQPYVQTAPTPYGYPVPYGYLQPDETLGTSPSFVVNPFAYGRQPVVSVVRRCQYPDGWNVTDFDRDVNGIPAGIDHTCPSSSGVRARY